MIQDIHPRTRVSSIQDRLVSEDSTRTFALELVSAIVGMSPGFIKKALNKKAEVVSLEDVQALLQQDAFCETFVPRSLIPAFLSKYKPTEGMGIKIELDHELVTGDALTLISRLSAGSIDCIVTSTPYWGTRLYDTTFALEWADGEKSPFGHEQTPEGFIRHSVEVLWYLKRVLRKNASVWWNLMDSYNTRTQIRGNASEALTAMQGKDSRTWREHTCRRYSAGHSFLKDGEQCLIPQRIAERASRIGYYVKSMIVWNKASSLPEPVTTRVSRQLEHILHLSLVRTPFFDKEVFRELSSQVGGRNSNFESDRVTDVWSLPTANGTDGHGAQFPIALPARCIALSTKPGDLVLDPFTGSGTTSLAALLLGRRSLGFDISEDYIKIARKRLKLISKQQNWVLS